MWMPTAQALPLQCGLSVRLHDIVTNGAKRNCEWLGSDADRTVSVSLRSDDDSKKSHLALSFCQSMISGQGFAFVPREKPVFTLGSSPRACVSTCLFPAPAGQPSVIRSIPAVTPWPPPVTGRAAIPSVAVRPIIAARVRSASERMACAARSTITPGSASVGRCGRLCQHKRGAQRQYGQDARCESRFEHFDLLFDVVRLLAGIRIASAWMTSPKGRCLTVAR
jgi:hypothetical protein